MHLLILSKNDFLRASETSIIEACRERMRESTDIFRVLVKTLLKAGIITDRTRDFYSVYVDLDELKEEGDRMVGDDIADEGDDASE